MMEPVHELLTNDGVRLSYASFSPPPSPNHALTIVLLHGWSGSRQSFCLNVPGLCQGGAHVLALDQRFHGASESPMHGFHIARLAADLWNFLETLGLQDVTIVGTSMGCAVIWSYVELFGTHRLKQAVFVDQAPLQNRAPDWTLGSKGCYDAATLASLTAQLHADLGAVADGNVRGCLSLPVDGDTLRLLKSETLRCQPAALAALMADHTQLDWRPVLPHLALPCLNMVGGDSGVFPPEGCLAVGHMAPDCCNVTFKRCNHWLYLEQPQEFNQLLLDFVKTGNCGRPKESVID